MSVACFAMQQFGIACERARAPQLWDLPLALVSDQGEVRVVSDEAAAFGLRPGISLGAARSLCAGLVALPYELPVYEEAARCVWDLFAVESSVVEPVSPEMCFVELTGPEALERVRGLSAAIARRVRVSVRVGLASSKFVARQAALREGDGATLVVPVGHEAAFLAPLPLDRVPGLEPRVRRDLERLGMQRFGDVLRLPPHVLQRRFKQVGLLLQKLAVGDDGDRVRPLWPPRCLEEALEFEDEVNQRAAVEEALRLCAERIAASLARRSEYCRTLTLTVGLSNGAYLQEAEKLALPAGSAVPLHRAALRLLQRLRCTHPLLEVRLHAGGLGSGSGVQLTLMDGNDFGNGLPHERRHRLEATLAYLRSRFPLSAPVLARLLRQARRIGLWTYPLGHMLDRPVQVAVNREGEPVRYWGPRTRGEVRLVHTRWKETEWRWGATQERTVWRVETDPSGLCELHQVGVRWRLGAVAD